jgi:hypothetical protein
MKRSEFLKRIGLGIAAIPFAKQVAGAVTEELTDEPGIWADEVPKEWTVEKTMDTFKETGYLHYEEPHTHKVGWPFRVNDQILTPDDKVYVVTSLTTGGIYGKQAAICTPLDARDPEITLTEENGKNVVIFGNLTSINSFP